MKELKNKSLAHEMGVLTAAESPASREEKRNLKLLHQ